MCSKPDYDFWERPYDPPLLRPDQFNNCWAPDANEVKFQVLRGKEANTWPQFKIEGGDNMLMLFVRHDDLFSELREHVLRFMRTSPTITPHKIDTRSKDGFTHPGSSSDSNAKRCASNVLQSALFYPEWRKVVHDSQVTEWLISLQSDLEERDSILDLRRLLCWKERHEIPKQRVKQVQRRSLIRERSALEVEKLLDRGLEPLELEKVDELLSRWAWDTKFWDNFRCPTPSRE